MAVNDNTKSGLAFLLTDFIALYILSKCPFTLLMPRKSGVEKTLSRRLPILFV